MFDGVYSTSVFLPLFDISNNYIKENIVRRQVCFFKKVPNQAFFAHKLAILTIVSTDFCISCTDTHSCLE